MRPNILLFLTDDHGAWASGQLRQPRGPVAGARQPGRGRHSLRQCVHAVPGLLARPRLPADGPHAVAGRHPRLDCRRNTRSSATTTGWQTKSRCRNCFALPATTAASAANGTWASRTCTPRGFDWCFGLPRWQGTHIQDYTYHLNEQPVTLTGNKTRFITDYALDFLDQTPRGRPFFLKSATFPRTRPYANQEPELVARYDEPLSPTFRRTCRTPGTRTKASRRAATHDGDLRSRYQSYYAAVTDIDRNVGRILDRLRAQGRLDDTLVIYTSDHG